MVNRTIAEAGYVLDRVILEKRIDDIGVSGEETGKELAVTRALYDLMERAYLNTEDLLRLTEDECVEIDLVIDGLNEFDFSGLSVNAKRAIARFLGLAE